MKKVLIFSILCTVGVSLFAQNGTKKNKHHYSVFIDDTTFVSSMPDQGATLIAYFKNDTIYKITTWFGFNFGDVTREYFYWNDTLNMIIETQKMYASTAIPKINPDSIKAHYTGRYIFKKGKLMDIAQKGNYSISDTPSTKDETESTFLMLSEKYRKVAYTKAKKKKNRTKVAE